MRKAFDWKRSDISMLEVDISMLEVEAVPRIVPGGNTPTNFSYLSPL
jgi:hypothetical protein